jgi:hypothetical protein
MKWINENGYDRILLDIDFTKISFTDLRELEIYELKL